MAIMFHPNPGQILICDYAGSQWPEMEKRRPVIVISPRFRERVSLCTVVPFSTTPPDKVMPYHCQIELDPPLPAPYQSRLQWVKADMLATVSFKRLFLPFEGKDGQGKREYDNRILDAEQFDLIRDCVKAALGL